MSGSGDQPNPIYDTLSHVLAIVAPALPEEWTHLISVVRPPDDCCDALAVWPSPQGIFFATSGWRPGSGEMDCAVARAVLPIQGRAVRRCWPLGAVISYDDVEAASAELMLDAWAILQRLKAANASRSLTPWPGRSGGEFRVSFRPPTGGCAAVDFSLAVELPISCS